MQYVFNSLQEPYEYVDKHGAGEYPDAPGKCPHKDCGIPVVMSKNGYYRRYIITRVFAGRIRIRRYKCLKCGHTVSMLPSFCLPYYTYGVEIIVCLMVLAIGANSKRKAAKERNDATEYISRRHVALYLSRLRRNRRFIQYGCRQISPGEAVINGSLGDIEWTKEFLTGNRPTLCPEFNAEFHSTMGKSFMSTQNRIA